MFRILLITIFLSVRGVCAIEVNVPGDWSQLEVPSEFPSTIKSMIHVLAPTGDAEASISEMKIVMSLDEAAESYVRGASKHGFVHSSTSTVLRDGYETRHITGVFPLPDSEDTAPVEAFIILTQDSMVSAAVTGAGASSKISDVLGWIQLPPSAIPAGSHSPAESGGRSIWELLGMGIVLVAVFSAIMSTKAFRKKKKDNKSEQATPRKPSDLF